MNFKLFLLILITSLHVSANKSLKWPENQDEILYLLRTNSPDLRELDLFFNHLGDEGCRSIADALQTNTTLTTLCLGLNDITSEGIKAIAEALTSNHTIKVLSLKMNSIDLAGAQALANLLRVNTALTDLDLFQCGIAVQGLRLITESLKNNHTLKLINLGRNPPRTPERTAALSEMLKTNTTLTTLKLAGWAFELQEVQEILEALRLNTTLTNIDMRFAFTQADHPEVVTTIQAVENARQSAHSQQVNMARVFLLCNEAGFCQSDAEIPLPTLPPDIAAMVALELTQQIVPCKITYTFMTPRPAYPLKPRPRRVGRGGVTLE